MTGTNQRLRDALKRIEGICTSALAHQPEGDGECEVHLRAALAKVCREWIRATTEPDDPPVNIVSGHFDLTEHEEVDEP